MSISYPLSFPSVSIRDITWEAKTKVAVTESPFTGEQQIVEHDGQWFELLLKELRQKTLSGFYWH
jgi:hypothetical protein